MNYNYFRDAAVAELKSYPYLKSSLEILPKQIALMKNGGIYGNGGGERVMHSISTDNAVVSHIGRIEQLEATLAANRDRVECIESALSLLTQRERELLQGFYINRQRNSVNNLARSYFTDRASLYRRAQRALEKYILACYDI